MGILIPKTMKSSYLATCEVLVHCSVPQNVTLPTGDVAQVTDPVEVDDNFDDFDDDPLLQEYAINDLESFDDDADANTLSIYDAAAIAALRELLSDSGSHNSGTQSGHCDDQPEDFDTQSDDSDAHDEV